MESGGDSGGPWLLEVDGKWEVAGVFMLSSINLNSDWGKDGIYGSISGAVRVSDFKDWIDVTMKTWQKVQLLSTSECPPADLLTIFQTKLPQTVTTSDPKSSEPRYAITNRSFPAC